VSSLNEVDKAACGGKRCETDEFRGRCFRGFEAVEWMENSEKERPVKGVIHQEIELASGVPDGSLNVMNLRRRTRQEGRVESVHSIFFLLFLLDEGMRLKRDLLRSLFVPLSSLVDAAFLPPDANSKMIQELCKMIQTRSCRCDV
jgi:hypothetical protein